VTSSGPSQQYASIVTLPAARDTDGLVARWERQQERYLPHREERFGIMLDVVARQTEGSGPRLLDLCCGTGSISKRALSRFPSASILAVDVDPAHLELGRRALGDRVEWRDADLREQAWAQDLPAGSFDAVLSATAIHWFQPDEVVSMYRTLAGLLGVGGVFANADHLPVSSSPIAALSQRLLDDWQTTQLQEAEDYHAYRDALRVDPDLRSLVEEGDRRFADKPPGIAAPLSFHREALVAAGFATADEVWRHHADAILVAIR
jgi:ubiquinone/menaquinone biosynthesis C-methylase UbiE